MKIHVNQQVTEGEKKKNREWRRKKAGGGMITETKPVHCQNKEPIETSSKILRNLFVKIFKILFPHDLKAHHWT